ncbi:prepilin peptidase [Myxococcota bacterium]|nr:prepilin peptidase [Myxococcota bacterium]
MVELQTAFGPTLLAFAFVWGTLWGSFLNVVIYRLPLELSVVHPGSRCGACGTPIRWYDNVPIVSFLLLRGRCRACGARYSPRYMLVEAACGVLSLAIFRAVVDLGSPEDLPWDLGWWLAWQWFAYTLVAIAFIDLEHTIVPLELTVPASVLGAVVAFAFPNGLGLEAVYGMGVGAGFLLLIVGLGWLIFRREAMGMGDVHILGMTGLWLGWRALPFVVLASSLQALLAVLIARVYGAVTGRGQSLTMTTEQLDERFDEVTENAGLPSHTVIPYGPFLALSALEAMLFGTEAFWWLMDRVFLSLLGAQAP